VQQLQSFRPEFADQEVHARNIASRPVEAGNETVFDRVARGGENDWNRRSRGFGCECRRDVPGRNDHRHLKADQVGRECRQSVNLASRPAVFDVDIAVLDITGFIQALAERGDVVRKLGGGLAVEKSDHRYPRLLRPRPERPRRKRGSARGQMQKLTAGKFHNVLPDHVPDEWNAALIAPRTSKSFCFPNACPPTA